MTRDPAVGAVRAAARAAPDLALLAGLVGGCRACPELAAARTSVVPGDFPPGATVLLVGEAPGAAEDAAGRPFVGRAGALLDGLLDDAGMTRHVDGEAASVVAVANVLKCRPPANRTPSRAEAARCGGWLDRQLSLAEPALVLALGGTAAAWAFGRPVRLADVRGRDHLIGRRALRASYHPSAALRGGPGGPVRAALAADLAAAAAAGAAIADGAPAVGPVGPETAADVAALTRAAFHAGPALDPPSGALREDVDRVAADLAAAPAVAGYAAGRLVAVVRTRRVGPVLWLRRLAVAPDRRRRGLAGAVVDRAHQLAADLGCTETRAGVRTAADGNQRLWARFGYATVADHGFWLELRRPLP